MKIKILFTASIAKHIIRFHLPYLKWFNEMGFEVHVACSGHEIIQYCDVRHHVPFIRTPYSFRNIKAYREIYRILKTNHFYLIHCQTPMESVLTRLASESARKLSTKVLYTTHGLYIYRGAPIVNWLFYFPVEKLMAKYTDAIITINSEDFVFVKRHFSPGKIYKINGIGVNPDRFTPISDKAKTRLKKEKGFKKDEFILIYAAEFIYRKNHKFILDSVQILAKEIP